MSSPHFGLSFPRGGPKLRVALTILGVRVSFPIKLCAPSKHPKPKK